MTDFKDVDKLMLELVCAGLSDWEPRDRSTAVARFFSVIRHDWPDPDAIG